MLVRVLVIGGFLLRKLVGLFGFGLLEKRVLRQIGLESSFAAQMFEVERHNRDRLSVSPSQLGQDLMVLGWLKEKRNGFFVEFGATDGISLSNTYLLEKEFGWTGILAEPGRIWHGKLRANRECQIDQRAVWSTTGATLTFTEEPEPELSRLNYLDHKSLVDERDHATESYEVETISLEDLLLNGGAPELVDFLSIDTEGSEYDILSAFDFSSYRFRVIAVEHNGTSAREDLFTLLSAEGYQRVLNKISRWDDWYVLPETL